MITPFGIILVWYQTRWYSNKRLSRGFDTNAILEYYETDPWTINTPIYPINLTSKYSDFQFQMWNSHHFNRLNGNEIWYIGVIWCYKSIATDSKKFYCILNKLKLHSFKFKRNFKRLWWPKWKEKSSNDQSILYILKQNRA